MRREGVWRGRSEEAPSLGRTGERADLAGWLTGWRRGRDGTAIWGLRPRQASVACRPSPCQHLRVSRQFSRSHRLTLFGNFDRFGLRRRVIRLTLVWIRFFLLRCGCDKVSQEVFLFMRLWSGLWMSWKVVGWRIGLFGEGCSGVIGRERGKRGNSNQKEWGSCERRKLWSEDIGRMGCLMKFEVVWLGGKEEGEEVVIRRISDLFMQKVKIGRRRRSAVVRLGED